MSSITAKKKRTTKPKTFSSQSKCNFYPLLNTDGTPSWPTNHLKKFNKESKSSNNCSKKVAVLVQTGAYSPIHWSLFKLWKRQKSHLKLMAECSWWLVVTKSRLICWTKARQFKTLSNAEHRVEIVELATSEYDWLAVGTWEAGKSSWRIFQ